VFELSQPASIVIVPIICVTYNLFLPVAWFTMALCYGEMPGCGTLSLVNRLLFKPPFQRNYDFPTEVIRLCSQHGNTICVTMLHRPEATLTLLVSHGNAEDLNTSYGYMTKLATLLDVNVVGYDYSGYGLSGGKRQMWPIRCNSKTMRWARSNSFALI
jgi:hypothetical protein